MTKVSITPGGVYYEEYDDSGNLEDSTYICKYFEIRAILVDIISMKQFVRFYFDALPENKFIVLPLSDFDRGIASKLVAYGFDLRDTSFYVSVFLRAFFQVKEEMNYPVITSSSKLGFYSDNLKFFLPGISKNGNQRIYSGSEDLGPHGKYKDWKKIVEEQVLGHKHLELALILGFCSPVYSVLVKYGLDLPTLTFSFCGSTSTGKSTALALAASIWGKPSTGSDGLITSWNSTENALMALLNSHHGFPLFLDEHTDVSVSPQVLYSIYNGTEKSRCDSSGELRPRRSWHTTVLSTGEHSILPDNCHDGLRVRVFEFSDLPWTDSAEQSQAIKRAITNNYGTAGRLFVRKLLKIPADVLTDNYKEYVKALTAKIPHSSISGRLSEYLAPLLLTARILVDDLDIQLSENYIFNNIVDLCVAISDNSDSFTRAYEHVMYSILTEIDKYYVADSGHDSSYLKHYPHFGIITKNHVWIAKERLLSYLSSKNFQDTSTILKEWAKRGLLIRKKSDRLSSTKRLAGIDFTAYQLVINFCSQLPPINNK